MPSPLEELLRSGMDEATTSVRADNEFVDRLIDHGRTARQHRQRTTWIGVAAAIVAVVAGASLIPLTRSDDNGVDAPQPRPTVSQYPLDWAKSLPIGPPTELSYIARGTLRSGDAAIPLPGDGSEVWGTLDGGWVVFIEYDDKRGIPPDTFYGVLAADGTIDRLPADPYSRAVQVNALSPDGTLFAEGQALIDVDSRTIVGRLPANAYFSYEWTDAGLIYSGRRENSPWWLWNPGRPPIELGAGLDGVVTTSARTLMTTSGCTQVAQLHSDGSMTPIFATCIEGRHLSLSPSGTYLLTRDFNVITASTGSVEPFPGIPEDVMEHTWVWWEDDDHFLVSAEGPAMGGPGGPRHAILVRCSVSTHDCERAGNQFTLAASDQLDLI
jgi:hypothetical protein